MAFLTALWLPILLSAVIVFVASSIMHMVLPYHRNDYGQLPDECQYFLQIGGPRLPDTHEECSPCAERPGSRWRFAALTTAERDASRMLESIPTPHHRSPSEPSTST